jgi:hypothetical protein
MPILRRVLFYALVLVFLVSCPLAILYVLGYDIRPAKKQALVHGGDLYVASFPIGAALYVDGRRYARPTPTSVLNLPPGPHQVRILMAGYLPWVDRVRIRAGETALLNDVLLIPRRWQAAELDEAAFEQLLPFSSDPHLLLRKGPLLCDLFLADTRQKKVLPLTLPESAYAQAEVLASVPLLEGAELLLEVRHDALRIRLLATLRSGPSGIRDISELAPEGIEKLEWAAGRQDELFFHRDGELTRIDVAAGTVQRGFLGGVRGFGVLGQKLYVLSRRAGVFTWTHGDSEPKALPGFEGIGAMFPSDEYVRLIPFKDGQIIFHGRSGGLVAGSPSSRLLIGQVRGFRVQNDPAGLLLWRRGGLGTLRLSAQGTSARKDPALPRLEWISVREAGVEQAFFVLAGTHILYRNADRVYLLSNLASGGNRVFPVTRVRSGTSVYYSEPAGELFYIDPETGRPSRLEIVRKTQLVEQLLLELRQRF